ncbi:hypothetical protein CDD80_4291 [Ophiocordyceps camponoti-rufipedis]|uniref:GATA-type domain-containing protein n=1 Tax=Ophiocordyceps camponoti-rufipedis TaxID=2004952 RepID=A0A2C5YZ02_9HYPO|nr:hypothetical protein CDD80_4291 [Ophiocordyceps camponoti-rufipedis]
MLPPQPADPISRASSTSTSASATLPQLPGIAALAASNAAPESPQLRATAAPQAPIHPGVSPAATSGGGGSNLPTCQNCTTSTTPLWRRDEFGAVLCNACGLFLKLHGRPRPISLKTDVIKSRNRVKTMRTDLAPKKKQQQHSQQQQQQVHVFPFPTDAKDAEMFAQNAAAAAQAIQRAAQKSTNGTHDGPDSPISRTETPSMYNHGLPPFLVDDPYQTGFGATGGADGSGGSPMNGDRSLDAPQSQEQLIALNSSLKTRVSELEVINELFRGRLSQLEQQEAAARRGQEVAGAEQSHLRSEIEAHQETEMQLRAQLEDSHRRENNLKRRLDELELELKEARGNRDDLPDRAAKRPRLEFEDGAVSVQEAELEPEFRAEPQAVPEAHGEPDGEVEATAEPAAEPSAKGEGEAEAGQEPERHFPRSVNKELKQENKMPTKSSRGGPAAARALPAKRKATGGKTILNPKRHRKIVRDSIRGITRPDIRRMARRGGVKRISAGIYDEAREALQTFLKTVLRNCVIYVEHRGAKTVTTLDVIHSLARMGKPIYGFDPMTYDPRKKPQPNSQATALEFPESP